mmetsp:Transcript_22559/g.49501  ORF Transcript_22559/g.49501 Transcript_22559/m.49501 type:complete len:111 (+) Transcript_22559:441-773(+)
MGGPPDHWRRFELPLHSQATGRAALQETQAHRKVPHKIGNNSGTSNISNKINVTSNNNNNKRNACNNQQQQQQQRQHQQQPQTQGQWSCWDWFSCPSAWMEWEGRVRRTF